MILLVGGFPVSSLGEVGETTILTSRIIDQDVYDGNKKLIGEVDDLIIKRSGRVKRLTVEFGGFLDFGDKLVVLPFKNFNMKNGNIFLQQTEEELKKRPEFDYYRQGLRPGYYYRVRRYAEPYRSPPLGYYYRQNEINGPPQPYEWALSPSRFLASVVMDRRLINEDGMDIGRVKDLLINRETNTIEKIIISSIYILGEDIHVALRYMPLGFTAYGLVYDIRPGDLKDYIYPLEK
jgi:sporulation protein YlmC with PRC-barrel domain